MATIFFLSAHCGNGPILAAGSVLVKSGLRNVVNQPIRGYSYAAFQHSPMINVELFTGKGKCEVDGI